MPDRMIKTEFIYAYDFVAPVGRLGFMDSGGAICGIILNCGDKDLYGVRLYNNKPYEPGVAETPLIKAAAAQIADYLGGKRKAFDLPLKYKGVNESFTCRVLDALRAIPPGQTRSYGEIAGMCGIPKAARAVGMINKRNPIPIIIPCHRVIGFDGRLTGYAGGMEMKQHLLDLEKKYYA